LNAAKLGGETFFPLINPTEERTLVITSQTTSSLSKPEGDDRVPLGNLGYFQARNRNRIYEAVLKEFAQSGISQATLARRLGKKPDVICRWLGAPGNWTLDTVSDLLFAISGAEAKYEITHPLEASPSNSVAPAWLNLSTANTSTTTTTKIINGVSRGISVAS
jgi:hypothetical protein